MATAAVVVFFSLVVKGYAIPADHDHTYCYILYTILYIFAFHLSHLVIHMQFYTGGEIVFND